MDGRCTAVAASGRTRRPSLVEVEIVEEANDQVEAGRVVAQDPEAGEKVDEADMPRMHISTYSLAETFDVGRDTGTQVSRLYTGPFPFKGELDRVIITLTD